MLAFSDGNDQSSEGGAYRLADMIMSYWRSRGYRGIKVWVVTESSRHGDIHCIRSNIGPGGPPRDHLG